MFFIGATGQLLTLILTVCLPLILFVTQPVKASDEIAPILYQVANTEVTENNVFFFEQTTFERVAVETKPLKVDYPSWLLKTSAVPDIVFFHEQLFLSNRTNKAPPVIYC
jgi:hypothetical protein